MRKIIEYLNVDKKTQDALYHILENFSDCANLYDALLSFDRIQLDTISKVATVLLFVDFEDQEYLRQNFDPEILSLYESLKEIENYQLANLEEAENFRMMLVAISKDIRVIVIKLLLILWSIKRFEEPLSSKQYKELEIVKEIFAPLAERLGLNFVKSEMEDICLKFLQPDVYNYLLTNVLMKKDANERQIEITKKRLQDILDELKIQGTISFRQKHFSSVYKKMTSKNIPLAKIYDLIAMRVIVKTVEDCYAVLGGIHGIYKPMPNRFKDYIANPKPNGYMSLHTTIIAENERPLEVQIRTEEMHRISEYGIAAHWMYKEKRIKKSALDEKLGWIRAIMESTQSLTSRELIESFKNQLNAGVIYVQTPKGKILEFPENSNIIDFAYAIHSEIGNTCVGGKINGKIKPLYTTLNNGDVVEIITSPNSKGPSRDWLNHVATASAKSKIKYYFRNELKDENIKTGKRMLDEAFKLKGWDTNKIVTSKEFELLLERMCFNTSDELFASVGYGSTSVNQIVNRLQSDINKAQPTHVLPKITISKNKDGVLIDGDSGMLVRYANCCYPVMGDKIIGYISRGRGVTIHRHDCHNIKFLEPERLIEAEWNQKTNLTYKVTLKIVSEVSNNLMQDIIKKILENKITLLGFSSKNNNMGKMVTTLSLQVSDTSQIEQIQSVIKNFNQVYEVIRE